MRKDGTRFWADILVNAIQDDQGKLIGFAKLSRDITARKQAEEELRRSEAYLAEGQRLSHTGSWAWNVSSGELFLSQEHFRIFGLEPAQARLSYRMFLDMIHPEDRPSIEQSFETAVRERSDYESEFRIVRPDGTIRQIHSLAHPVFNDTRELREYVGTVIDATEQHQARVALEKALEEIKTLKDHLYQENVALREEIDRTWMFEEIVGSSPAVRAVVTRIIFSSAAEPEDEEPDSVKASRRRGTRWDVAGVAVLLVLLIASLTFATVRHTRNQLGASFDKATFRIAAVFASY